MYVILESYLSMVADYPDAYRGQKGFDFIKEVPTTWDETRFPMGEIGEYCVALRRKGDVWYIGAINNDMPRDITLPMDFLGSGIHTITVHEDAPDSGEDPNNLNVRTFPVTSTDSIKIHMARDGGFAAIVRR